MFLVEEGRLIEAIKPQTGAAARSGDWVSLKGYAHLTILVQLALGNAATTAITVDKATDVAGTGEVTGITLANAYKTGTAPASSDLMTKIASAASIVTSNAGSGSEVYAIEIDAAELGDGYDCVQVELGASNAANLVSAAYILTNPSYAGAPAGQISALAN